MTRTVVSKSTKTKAFNSYGRRVRTEQVIYKIPNGKKKNGKPAFTSVTRHDAID